MNPVPSTASSKALAPPRPEALQQQLLRYAQDIQELMEQHAVLQARHENVLQSLGLGTRNEALLHDLVQRASELHLVTDAAGTVLGGATQSGTLGLGWQGADLASLAGAQASTVACVLARFSGPHPGAAMVQCQLSLAHHADSGAPPVYDALVAHSAKGGRVEIHWFLCRHSPDATSAWAAQRHFLGLQEQVEGVVITGTDATILALNPAYARMTGYTQAELLGCNPRMLDSGRNPADFFPKFWAQLQETGAHCGEWFNRRKNGQLFFCWQAVRAVQNCDGETISYMAAVQDLSPSEHDTRQLTRLAYHDPLTGLPNRRMFEERLAQSLATAAQGPGGLCVLYLDLDRFKPINDEFGHEAGDEVLMQVGARLQASVRRGDLVARVGGDEFVVLLQGMEGADMVAPIAESLLLALERPVRVGPRELSVGVSMGAACFPADGADMAALIAHADVAMFSAKRFGTKLCFYETASAHAAPAAD